MKNIILFGPPGSGKGTHSERLVAKYGLQHISTGEILRAEEASGSSLGIRMADIINKGNLAPDEIVNEIVKKHINRYSSTTPGFIFDGFPRTHEQAKALDEYLNAVGSSITATIFLDVPKDQLLKRLLNRAKELGRADDTEEVIEQRIMEYTTKTLAVGEFYKNQDKLYLVNGIGHPSEVFQRIVTILD